MAASFIFCNLNVIDFIKVRLFSLAVSEENILRLFLPAEGHAKSLVQLFDNHS